MQPTRTSAQPSPSSFPTNNNTINPSFLTNHHNPASIMPQTTPPTTIRNPHQRSPSRPPSGSVTFTSTFSTGTPFIFGTSSLAIRRHISAAHTPSTSTSQIPPPTIAQIPQLSTPQRQAPLQISTQHPSLLGHISNLHISTLPRGRPRHQHPIFSDAFGPRGDPIFREGSPLSTNNMIGIFNHVLDTAYDADMSTHEHDSIFSSPFSHRRSTRRSHHRRRHRSPSSCPSLIPCVTVSTRNESIPRSIKAEEGILAFAVHMVRKAQRRAERIEEIARVRTRAALRLRTTWERRRAYMEAERDGRKW